MTSHLAQLGAVEVGRGEYLELVRRAIDCPLPSAFAR
jgi:Leu/Phe-tRNA-protein transferase